MSDVQAGPGGVCAVCGTAVSGGSHICAPPPVEATAATAQVVPPPPPASPAPWQSSLPAPFNTVPVEVVLIAALMAFAGVLVLWPTLKALPDVFNLLGSGNGLGFQFGLLLFTVWIVLALFGTSLLVLAWRLGHADRVARGLSYCLCGSIGAAILLGDQQGTQLVLVMLACFGAIAVLALVPRVQQFYAGGQAPQGDQPTSVVIARTLVAVWASCMTLVGAMFLPLGGLGSKFVLVGLVMLALGIGAFYANKRVGRGDQAARKVVTVGAALYALLTLIVGRSDPGLLIPLGIAVGIVWNLWRPEDARRYFTASHGQ
jgi:hypothetical protein